MIQMKAFHEMIWKWTESLMQFTSVEFIEQPTGFKDDEWLLNYAPSPPYLLRWMNLCSDWILKLKLLGLGKYILCD